MLRMMSLLVMLGIVLSGCRHADWSIGEVDGQIERIAPTISTWIARTRSISARKAPSTALDTVAA